MAGEWYAWESQSAFEAWHGPVVAALALPRMGVNQATGEPEPDAQWTVAYTAATEVAPSDWRAPVGAAVAEAFSTGLGAVSEPPPYPDPLS